MKSHQKSQTPLSKSTVISWLHSLLPDLPRSTKIEDLGDGVTYCRILNKLIGSPALNKISWTPRSEYEFLNNLKQAQNTLMQENVGISFDCNRVSKRKFLENWTLVTALYKHFNSLQESALSEDNSLSNFVGHSFNSSTNNSQPPKINNNTRRPPSLCFENQPFQPQQHYQQIQLQLQTPPSKQSSFISPNFQIQTGHPHTSSFIVSNYPCTNQNVNTYNLPHFYQKNQNQGNISVAVLDRIKEILYKSVHDSQKVRQIRMLLGIPTEEYEMIKIEDEHKDFMSENISNSKGERKEFMVEEDGEIQEVYREKASKKKAFRG